MNPVPGQLDYKVSEMDVENCIEIESGEQIVEAHATM